MPYDISSDAQRGTASSAEATPISQLLKPYRALWPVIVGLVFARAGIIVGSYGSYAGTDAGLITDSATMVSMSGLLVVLVVLAVRKISLSKRQVYGAFRIIVLVQTALLSAIAFDAHIMPLFPGAGYILHSLNEMAGIMCMAYWLRSARGCSTTTAMVFICAALALSEAVIGLCWALPFALKDTCIIVLTPLQLPLAVAARKRVRPYQICSPTQDSDYLGFMTNLSMNPRFLAVTGVGIGMMAIVIGFLRGYPDGAAIPFTLTTRVLYAALTVGLCASAAAAVLRGKQYVTTAGVWAVMWSLAVCALIVYAALPDSLEYGAVFTTSLNAIMVAFIWYVIVAFMGVGWRDPYYYAIGGFVVFLLPRALARVFLVDVMSTHAENIVMVTVIAGFLMASVLFVFTEMMHITQVVATNEARGEQDEDGAPKKNGLLTRVMGLDDAPDTYSGLRAATMERSAKELGRQFLLSDREIEVVTLYALGYTQQRVAEELFISPGTVHAHIKRIYAKTGLHSRQAILDYLQQYAD